MSKIVIDLPDLNLTFNTRDRIKVDQNNDVITISTLRKKEKTDSSEQDEFNRIMNPDTPDNYSGVICGVTFPQDRFGQPFYTLKSMMSSKQFDMLNNDEYDSLEAFENSLSREKKEEIIRYIENRDYK